MKKLFMPLLAVFLVCSCAKYELPSDDDAAPADNSYKRSVQFVMKGLSVDYGSRATLVSEGMTDLWIWEGSTLLKHQVSTDADFGAPTVSLTIGAHDLTFVASKSEGQTWANGVWKCTKVKDTYGTVLSYTVSKSSSSKQVEMTRRNGKVMWTVEDALPSGASTINVSVDKQCYGLDASLSGVDVAAYSSVLDVSGYVGQSGLAVSMMVLPESGSGSQVKASASVKKSDGSVMCTYSNDITVKANQACNIHGAFFSGGGSMQMSLSNAWGAQTDYDI